MSLSSSLTHPTVLIMVIPPEQQVDTEAEEGGDYEPRGELFHQLRSTAQKI